MCGQLQRLREGPLQGLTNWSIVVQTRGLRFEDCNGRLRPLGVWNLGIETPRQRIRRNSLRLCLRHSQRPAQEEGSVKPEYVPSYSY